MTKFFYLPILVIFLACGEESNKSNEQVQAKAQAFLDNFTKDFQRLYAESAEADWSLNTKIIEGDTINSARAEAASEAFANFTGSKENIEAAKKYLGMSDQLTALQTRQYKNILYNAAANPAIAKKVVKEKIKAETKQTEDLFGFDFQLNGKSVSTNDLDKILKESSEEDERLAAWNASKAVGKTLKTGLETLRSLRNQSVQALDYEDYFHYQVSDYGMTTEEMLELCQSMVNDAWPLYRELHTWARHELAQKYGQEVPEYLPAHWLPNRWGQDWTALVNVEGINLDETLGEKSGEWIVREGEKFYVSLGFDALPKSFYDKSSLYPAPDNVDYKKNNHASAWHMNLAEDVRSLMSIVPNTEWWETCLHELGHIYYYMTYSNKDVPFILRGGANRGYHEAIGTQIGLASLQKPFLQQYGLIPDDVKTDDTQLLLKEALNYIVFVPFSAGVMTFFEHAMYSENLPLDSFNKQWWALKKQYQGIVPPSDRDETFCDAASKTHINNDAAQYYDYAVSNVLLFQFHEHIAKNILNQDPHATNYFGSKETGDFLKKLMYPGATVDWREHLQSAIGTGMSAQSMVNYFAPLMDYLKEQNKGRTHTLPEAFPG